MKLAVVAAVVACLAPHAPGAAAEKGGKNPIVGRVKVVGSDAGACAGYEGKSKNCGASQTLTARKYADGTARGRFSHVFGLEESVVEGNAKNKILDLTNVRMWSASIDCLNFITGEDGTVQAVVTGQYTRCDLLIPKEAIEMLPGGFAGFCEVGGLFVAAAKIDGDGEPYYTEGYNIVEDPVDGPPKRDCNDFALNDRNFGYKKHVKGRLEIKQNQVEDV